MAASFHVFDGSGRAVVDRPISPIPMHLLPPSCCELSPCCRNGNEAPKNRKLPSREQQNRVARRQVLVIETTSHSQHGESVPSTDSRLASQPCGACGWPLAGS